MIKRDTHCVDCTSGVATVFYGIGQRCQTCSDAFKAKLYAERLKEHEEERARKLAHVCGEDDEVCEECCDHEFDMSEGGYCINGCEKHYTGN